MPLRLRHIGRQVGEEHPQKIKYHLLQLQRAGVIALDYDNERVLHLSHQPDDAMLASLPILGAANCGQPLQLADDRAEGHLRISRALLPRHTPEEKLYTLRAVGDSMNKANVDGKAIEDGDLLIVLRRAELPKNGDYVVSLIDNAATVKRFYKRDAEIFLMPESTSEHPMIVISEDDDYKYMGTVMRVIKKPVVEWND